MLNAFGERQQELLELLHRYKTGMTIDELAERLDITRTAVKQHLSSLERSSYIEKGALRLTKGRPSRTFRLTAQGLDIFPKQYSWFSSLLLRAIKAERGSEGLSAYLRGIASTIARNLAPRVKDKEDFAKIKEITKIMNELAYDAQISPKQNKTDKRAEAIEASNCVYHHLAQEFPEVCQFDIELLSQLSGTEINHQECIIKGGNVCRFAFEHAKKSKSSSS